MRSYDILIIFYAIILCGGIVLIGLTVFDSSANFLIPVACTVVIYGLMQMDHYTLMKKLEPELKIPEKEEKKP